MHLTDNIHSKWFGKYDHLEREHGYIQWLFPVFESKGMNYLSKKLRREVAELMRKDEEIAHRFIKSYQLMLDFYGMELADLKTGEIRASSNWKTRYQNLDSSYHNNLRICKQSKNLHLFTILFFKKSANSNVTRRIGF